MTIRIALKRAKQSKFKRARVGAVIERSGRILVSGHNRLGYTKLIRNRKANNSIHAETEVILQLLKARRQNELIGANLYVSRLGLSGEARLAKPCRFCDKLIRAVGIRRVFYTTDLGVSSYEP